jgi:hypothetical protein
MLRGTLWLPEGLPRASQCNAEAISAAALHKYLRRHQASLREHDFEEALAYLVERLWYESHSYWKPSFGLSFPTWATRHLPGHIVDWYRQRFYDARYPGHDARYGTDIRRELAFPASTSASNGDGYIGNDAPTTTSSEPGELDIVVSALEGNIAAVLDVPLARVLDTRNRSQDRDQDLVAERRARPAA